MELRDLKGGIKALERVRSALPLPPQGGPGGRKYRQAIREPKSDKSRRKEAVPQRSRLSHERSERSVRASPAAACGRLEALLRPAYM